MRISTFEYVNKHCIKKETTKVSFFCGKTGLQIREKNSKTVIDILQYYFFYIFLEKYELIQRDFRVFCTIV